MSSAGGVAAAPAGGDPASGDGGRTPQMSAFRVYWAQPFLSDEECDAVQRVMRDRRISMGDEVALFEREAAAMVRRAHGVAVANGTAAVELSLTLLGIGPGDRVLVSSLSHIATVNAIVLRGAHPVFCDVDPATLNMDMEDAAGRAEGARAILVSDYCGSAVDYDALARLADRFGLLTALDGAQSLCTTWRGAPTCSLTDIASMSFHTAKVLFAGEGGMVFTDDPDVAERARRLRQMGEIPGRKYVHEALTRNLRVTNIAAAIGRVQLGRAAEMRARRERIVAWYDSAIADLPDVTRVVSLPECVPVWFSYPTLVPRRDAVAREMAARGVETRALYPVPAYRQPIPEYAGFADQARPQAERRCDEALNLPLFWEMTQDDVATVVQALREGLAATA